MPRRVPAAYTAAALMFLPLALGAQRPADSAATTTAPARVPSPGTLPMRPVTRAEIRTAPDGPVTGTVVAPGVVVPIARERGWVRVRFEGWVRETQLLPADSSLSTALSAADLRADPDAVKGKLVRWRVEVLAFQRADALRREFTVGEPYLLARGPAGENAILYLALPAALVEQARALPPLAVVQIVARVRTGRSAPTNVPILDVETLTAP